MGEVRIPWLAGAGESHQALYREFRGFVAANVAPHAAQWDREQRIGADALELLAKSGYLGCSLPREFGGKGWDTVTFGLLNEAFGRGSSALTDVLTCQAMVAMTLLKWGKREQKEKWLPPLAGGSL